MYPNETTPTTPGPPHITSVVVNYMCIDQNTDGEGEQALFRTLFQKKYVLAVAHSANPATYLS